MDIISVINNYVPHDLVSLIFDLADHWLHISEYQKLSVNFIKEFSDRVDWVCISAYQNLSEDFMLQG